MDDWTLSDTQMEWMLQHINQIDEAFAADDLEWLRHLADASDYKRKFGEMSFDEAYDRYECTLEWDDERRE